MSYPYHRLLLFLVSRKVDVNEALERYGLPPVGGLWIANAKTRLRDGAPHHLASYIDSDDLLKTRDGILYWAGTEGIYELWTMQEEFGGGPPDPDLDLAFRIFINPYSRALMGMLLLSEVSDKEISEISEEKFDLALTDEVLEIYRRIFWDVNKMGRTAWEPFILELQTKEERHYITLGLPGPKFEDIRAILGMKLVVDHMEIADHIASTAHVLYKLAIKQPLPEEAGAIKWADLALRAMNAKKQITPKGNAEDELLLKGDGFKGLFSVQATTSSHPTLADLQGHKPPPKNVVLKEEGEE